MERWEVICALAEARHFGFTWREIDRERGVLVDANKNVQQDAVQMELGCCDCLNVSTLNA